MTWVQMEKESILVRLYPHDNVQSIRNDIIIHVSLPIDSIIQNKNRIWKKTKIDDTLDINMPVANMTTFYDVVGMWIFFFFKRFQAHDYSLQVNKKTREKNCSAYQIKASIAKWQ